MIKTFCLAIFILVIAGEAHAQSNPGQTLSAKDSAEILSDLASLFDSTGKPTSYVFANFSLGNRLFSLKNYSLDAKQSDNRVLIYSPSVAYFHKSGLSLTVGANLLEDVTGFGVNQYSVVPAFDLMGNKDIAFSVSYAHYFVNNKFSSFSSPIQNDIYTAFTYKKPWLRPGIAVGYSTGEYKEAKYKDTAITNVRKHFYDSVTNKLKTFSMVLSVGHQFLWDGIFTESDGLGVTTTLMGNLGSSRIGIHHRTNAELLFNFLNKRGRIPKFQNSGFEMQSIGLNIDVNYSIGNFTFEPQVYSDYYLPETESKKFSQVFVFNLGYSF